MGAKERATRLHESGLNCAQSVLGALVEYTGLDEKTALAVSAGFGGGVRSGEICGAVSGAVMALGLAFPHTDGEDEQASRKIAGLIRAYTSTCMEAFGALCCRDLRGGARPCAVLIEEATELAENYIIKNKG